MLAQRWANVGMQPLGQRWANWQIHIGPTLVSRRWPNVRVDVGPTLGQRRNASWECFPHYWSFVRESIDDRWLVLTEGQWCGAFCQPAGDVVQLILFCMVTPIVVLWLSHWVIPYDTLKLGQHWSRWWLIALQPLPEPMLTIIKIRSCGIQLRTICVRNIEDININYDVCEMYTNLNYGS